MSDRPTPETDTFAIKIKTTCLAKYWVPVDIARKLERERDEARKQVAMWKSNHDNQVALKAMLMERPDLGDRASRIAQLIRERDEARELLASEKITRNHIIKRSVEVEKERDEAREALADWENAAVHVEADHPDEKHCGCVPVLRKLLHDARRERDEAQGLLRILAGLVAYGLGQSGEEWSLEAMRQATTAIQNAKSLEATK